MAGSKPRHTDEEFLRLWYEHQSPTKVARELGIAMRNVLHRRNKIEAKLGVSLPVDSAKAKDGSRVRLLKQTAVVSIQLENAVVLVGSDAHIWPGPRTTMQRAFLKLAKQLKPSLVVANGDFCDFAGISRWPSLSWNDLRKKPSVKEELEAVQDYMDALVKATPGAQHVWPFGNHDQRFEAKLSAAAPDFVGVHGVSLKDHFPAWTPCWRVDINDDVVIRHRELGGEHADYRNTFQGKTLVTGHDHRTGVTPVRNYSGVRYGVRCGFLADGADDVQFIEYLEARCPNWFPAFAVLTFRDGVLLYPELCTKHADDVVQFRGELIAV